MEKYQGRHINMCVKNAFVRGRVEVIIVNGTFPNYCGHALLNVQGYGIVHISGMFKKPYFLAHFEEFHRYLRDNNKTVLDRYNFVLPNPDGASRRFYQLTYEPWRWLGLVHNCATFIRDILAAGGIASFYPANCPDSRLDEKFQRKYSAVESTIKRTYHVP